MKQATSGPIRGGVALAGCLCALVFLAADIATAGITGSKHDFSGSDIASDGACSACHIPHFGQTIPDFKNVIWSRSLVEEKNYFDQKASPNYAPGTTILCYDCHDNHSLTEAVDDDPPDASFDAAPLGNRPQDVAFDDDMSLQPPATNPNNPRDGFDNDNKPGYYENIPSDTVGYPVTGVTASTFVSGHYFKNDPGGGIGGAGQGDKLPCADCHDPHDNLNQAFIRSDLGGTSLSGKKASTNMAYTYDEAPSGRDDRDSREFCIACHGTSEEASTPVTFSEVNPSYQSAATIVKPTVRVSAHRTGMATACTKCHKHNGISVSCNDCHGFPPLLTKAQAGNELFLKDDPVRKNAENYEGGAGAHQRHKDALGDAIFQCEICHGPNPGSAAWHNTGVGAITDGSNVNIMGLDTYWSPPGYPGTITPNYNPSGGVEGPGAGDTAYVFSRMGGDEQRCTGVACHGNPLAGETAQLNWTDDMIDGDVPEPAAAGEIQICKWCHDATPAMIFSGANPFGADKNNPANYAYGANVMGNGLPTAAGFGAEVNGHGVGLAGAVKAAYDKDAVNDGAGAVGAEKECTVCHDATYVDVPLPNHPQRTHFPSIHAAATDPRDEKRLRDTINSGSANIGTSTTFPTGPDEACSACHQNGVNTAADGLDATHHGIPESPPSGGYVPSEGYVNDPAFTRSCRQCHDVHGSNWNGAGRNLFMVGKWIDVNADRIPSDFNSGEGAFVDSSVVPAAPTLAAITSADNRVVFTATTGTDSFDENDGAYDTSGVADRDDICAGCHVPATGGGTGTGGGSHAGLPLSIGEMRGQNCMSCHDHDYDNSSTSADAFMPSGCFGCHGRSLATGTDTQGDPAYNGQYWPDGTKPDGTTPGDYFDDDPGAHYRHVQALAQQLYGETVDLVVADSGNGTTYNKQRAICAFCHPNPGGADPEGGAHTRNDSDVRDPLDRVTVYLDSDDTAAIPVDVFRKLTVGALASELDRTSPAPVNSDQAYSYTDRNCSNLVCHNQAATPTLASTLPGNWDAPPDWAPGANADCSNTSCHAAGVTPAGTYTNAHNIHVGDTQKNYACTECHANNYAPVNLGHGNGEVDMVWNNAASIEGSVGADNGFYDKEPGAAASPGDTAFAYKSGAYDVTCNLVYCHGGDGAWGGGDTTPVWDDSEATLPAGVYCGSCHDGNGTVDPAGDASVVATGNHADHLTAAYGPGFANPPGSPATSCLGTLTTGCHTDFQLATTTHVDGTVTFDNIDVTLASSPLGTLAVAIPTATDTDRCSHCHSTAGVTVFDALGVVVGSSGTALVKTQANWDNAAYELPCLTCHNGTDAASTFADGTGRAAPDMLGTDLENGSGAEIRGHGLTTGTYPVSANPAANKYCTACHSAAAAHLNDSADTTYEGNRLLGTINGDTPTTVTGACNACHAKAGVATKNSVNMHANNGANYVARNIEEDFPNPPTTAAMECAFCHEPHGMTANGTGFNIYMVPPTITVATPGATTPSTGSIRFEVKTGAYSYDDDDTAVPDSPDLCVVCHEANSMMQNDGGNHGTGGYDNNEEGSDCTGCHQHNLDGDIATADGFMPVECNACHSYPGLAAGPHLLSLTHNVHVDALPTGKGFTCGACHYQSSHNNAGMKVGQAWPAVTDDQKQVRFAVAPAQFAWNPMAATGAAGNPAARTLDSLSFDNATHVCNNLYCHGADTPTFTPAFPPADAPSPYVSPDWDLAATGDCGTCHRYTAANPPAADAHDEHAGNAAGQYAIGCAVCHYTTTADGTSIAGMAQHVNTVVEIAFSATADPHVDGSSAYSANDDQIGTTYGSCSATYCHSNGTDTVAPYDSAPAGTAAPAVALAWNVNGDCWSCHGNGTDSGSPAYTDGTPKANKHAIHTGTGDPTATANTNGYGCQVCHWPTTHDNGTSIFASANHVNGTYDIDHDTAAPALAQFDPVAGTPASCDNANCHGGNDGISWNLAGPISCNTCHGMESGGAIGNDVNNFAWDGSTQSKISNATGGDYETQGHGKESVVCVGCHSSSVGHDTTAALTGANPFRLRNYLGTGPGDFTCSRVATGCHATGPASLVRDHTRVDVAASGWAPQVDTWHLTPKCVDCHDPHGDPGNIHMIQRELVEGSGDNWVPAAIENNALVFSDDTTGADAGGASYADLDDPFSSLCQECHETSDTDFTSFIDGTSGSGASHPAVGANPGNCSGCHLHSGAFAPSRCEGCHGTPPYTPGGGKAAAPDVVQGTLGEDSVWDGSWWNSTQGGNSATQQGGHGDPDGKVAVKCTDCHDIGLPTGYHLNGTLESTGPSTVDGELAPQNVNENTAHLKAEFIAATGGDSVQVQFDNTCSRNQLPDQTGSCHATNTVGEMRHARDPNSTLGQVTFGEHLTESDGNGLPTHLPIDSDLTTIKSATGTDYAPCISCHDPHGTRNLDTRGSKTVSSNRMMRYDWGNDNSTICRICH